MQEIINMLAAAQQSGDWTKLTEQLTVWEKQAKATTAQTLDELKRQFIEEDGPQDVASLLGKYRGRLSSVDEFIQNKN